MNAGARSLPGSDCHWCSWPVSCHGRGSSPQPCSRRGSALLALIVMCAILPVDTEAAARSADRGLATDDALSTSLQFVGMSGVFGEAIRARANDAARRGDARTAVPFTADWRLLVAAAVMALTALGLALFTDPATRTADRRDEEHAALTSEAAGLRAHAEALADDPVTSPDRDALAALVEQLATELDRTANLGSGLAALEQARSELEASITDRFLAEKSAVQGLIRSLEARPLVDGRANASAQLEALGESLDELSAQEREALADRLAALAATQAVGNPEVADALGEAGTALAFGDFDLAEDGVGDGGDGPARRRGVVVRSDGTGSSSRADWRGRRPAERHRSTRRRPDIGPESNMAGSAGARARRRPDIGPESNMAGSAGARARRRPDPGPGAMARARARRRPDPGARARARRRPDPGPKQRSPSGVGDRSGQRNRPGDKPARARRMASVTALKQAMGVFRLYGCLAAASATASVCRVPQHLASRRPSATVR